MFHVFHEKRAQIASTHTVTNTHKIGCYLATVTRITWSNKRCTKHHLEGYQNTTK